MTILKTENLIPKLGNCRYSHFMLTPKQSLFVKEYLVDLNATQAAIRAGYELSEWEKCDGYYVYALIDPQNESIFYIGKVKGRRCFGHEAEWRAGAVKNYKKFEVISNLKCQGLSPRVAILGRQSNEHDAYSVEKAFIFRIGKERLTNLVRGTQTDAQRASAEAKEMLSRVIPFDVWRMTGRRTPLDIQIYHVVVNGLTREAQWHA